MMRLLGILVGSALAVAALVMLIGIPRVQTESRHAPIGDNGIIRLPDKTLAATPAATPEPEPEQAVATVESTPAPAAAPAETQEPDPEPPDPEPLERPLVELAEMSVVCVLEPVPNRDSRQRFRLPVAARDRS